MQYIYSNTVRNKRLYKVKKKGQVRYVIRGKTQDFLKVQGDWQVKKSHLYYEGRQIVPKSDIENIIRKYFEHPETTGGAQHLHERIGRKYIGIGRRDVQSFINKQITTQLKKPTNVPDKGRGISIGSFPGHIVEIDLVFMEKQDQTLNHGYRYICTMLDRFSGRVGAEPLKKKDAKLVLECMMKILKRWNLGKPKVLASDNGTEFEGSVKTWCNKNDVKRLYTQAYSPLARIERFNKTIRHGLNRFMFMFKTKTWFDVVQAVVKNRNTSVNFDIKKTPNELFKLDKKEIKPTYQKLVTARMQRLQDSKGYQHRALKKDDKVRLSLKKEKKTVMSKETAAQTWSSKIYRVTSIIRTIKGKPRYKINDHPGVLYYRTQLQKIDEVDPKSFKTFEDRPIFDATLFLKERHLKTMDRKKKLKSEQKPKTPPAPRRSTRIRKKPKRYGSGMKVPDM